MTMMIMTHFFVDKDYDDYLCLDDDDDSEEDDDDGHDDDKDTDGDGLV